MSNRSILSIKKILPTGFVPLPVVIFFTSSIPDEVAETTLETIKSLNSPESVDLDDAEILEIIKTRYDENDRSRISAVFGNPDFLPFSFLELGIKRGASVCRLVRNFSSESRQKVIDQISHFESTDFVFSKEELREIFCIAEKGIQFSKDFFADVAENEAASTALRRKFEQLLPVPVGTGFLVGDSYILTNHHVLPTPEAAQEVVAQFGYEQDTYGRRIDPVSYGVDADFFFTNYELDYTLVKLQETPMESYLPTLGKAGTTFNWIPISTNESGIMPPIDALIVERLKDNGASLPPSLERGAAGDPVNIIQHPKGKRKQIVLSSNRVIGMDDNFVQYEADADFSSSGSPVLNQQWQLVALHHAAIPLTDENGEAIMTEENGRRDISIAAQQGVRICRIADDLIRKAIAELMTVTTQDISRVRDIVFDQKSLFNFALNFIVDDKNTLRNQLRNEKGIEQQLPPGFIQRPLPNESYDYLSGVKQRS